jgi:antitoxin VapB
MSLNIKNPETHALAKELASLTGENVTEAVTVALQERLNRLRRKKESKALVEWMMEMGRDNAARLGDKRFIDHAELLYDERGLPK